MREILPLGSIVSIKTEDGNLVKIVVIGRCLIKNDEYFDYAGVFFPYGFTNVDTGILFKTESIEEVIFKGFENKTEEKYGQKIMLEYNAYIHRQKKKERLKK